MATALIWGWRYFGVGRGRGWIKGKGGCEAADVGFVLMFTRSCHEYSDVHSSMSRYLRRSQVHAVFIATFTSVCISSRMTSGLGLSIAGKYEAGCLGMLMKPAAHGC